MSDREQHGCPQGWKRTTLGEALPIHYGKARNQKYGTVRDDTPVYGSSGRIDTFHRALTGGPSLIIGRKGTVGATYYCPEPCWPIDTVYFTEATADEDLRFFKYLLDHLQLARMDRSTAVPGLSRDDYNATDVFIPGLDQQRLIVAEIEKQFSRLDEAVANLKRVKANLKRYKAAVLKAAVEGKLTEDWRKAHPNVEPASKLLERILIERRCRWEEDQISKFKGKGQEPPKNWKEKYKEPVSPHGSNLLPLPKEWCRATLDQTLWHLRSGTAETSRRESTDYPVLKSSAVRHGVIDFEDLNYLQRSQSFRPENFLRRGDFLITRLSGSLDYVGCSAVVKDVACEGIQYPDRVFCGKLVTGTGGTYLCYCFQHSGIRKALEEAAKSTAGHQRISMSDLYPLTLPLPPVAEQQRIVSEVERRLSVIEELESAVQANLIRADRLRQAILARAFHFGCSRVSPRTAAPGS